MSSAIFREANCSGTGAVKKPLRMEDAQTVTQATGTVRGMNQPLTPETSKIALHVLTSETGQEAGHAAPAWHGWSAVNPLPEASALLTGTDSPEPLAPQGAYGVDLDKATAVPEIQAIGQRQVELLAPAGGPEAAFAAFHFGADAIYLGLKKFSARAEAENFTLEEVDEITAYAHSLQPRRRVFVTVNTVIRQDELRELVEAVAALEAVGVDALIIQDLGVYHLVRQYFPKLELHASTQLAVHNRAGAEVLRQLGFQRVVLARELTFKEVHDITAQAGIETEVFIHGALCYSYSGLCLFSAQTLGRSGNRGKCAYSCRDSYDVTDAPGTLRDGSPVRRDPRQGFPFSMKDLALPDHIPALRAAGVSCFKVEGRKKSPLYVATTTTYYRQLIDGRLTAAERPQLEADMQTVFSRPWTRLFVHSHKDKEVADRDTVGHRGTLIGNVEAISRKRSGIAGKPQARLCFRTQRPLERHDGLQIDLPVLGKPFGFAVDRLFILNRQGKRHEVFQAPAGAAVEIELPGDHPDIPLGAPVYCSSSQAVKQKYRHARPKPGAYRTKTPVAVEVILTNAQITAIGRIPAHVTGLPEIEVISKVTVAFTAAKDPALMETAVHAAFEKLGATGLELAAFQLRNEGNRFAPVSLLNQLRRDLTAELAAALGERRAERVARILAEVKPQALPAVRPQDFSWSIKIDRVGFLDAFEKSDWEGLEEVVVDIARDHPVVLAEALELWGSRLGRERIRLALPAITRYWEENGLRQKIHHLREAGWQKWEAANLSAWHYLDVEAEQGTRGGMDLTTDWSVYVLNRLAARQLLQMGVSRFALSPEDGIKNLRALLAEFGPRAVLIVHQDTHLFVAESCAYANLIGGCPGKANCTFESMEMVSSHGEKVTALDYHCRTIVLNHGPFCLSTKLPELAGAGAVSLRADFIYRAYTPAEVRERWRLVRAGRAVPGGHAANFEHGIL
jgi:putative protease